MDIITVLIWVVLMLASIGGWLVIGFLRYRVYFKKVNVLLAQTSVGNLWKLPTTELMRLDDVIRRSYYAKQSVEQAATAAIEETIRYPIRP